MQTLAIFGAGGHGKVVADAAQCMGWKKIVFFDDRWPILNKVSRWSVVGNTDILLKESRHLDGLITAIGDNRIRASKAKYFKENGILLTTIIHPSATISQYTRVEEGTVIFAGTVVNPDCVIGTNCILNTSSTIDHDCLIGNGVHICPGAHLAGEVIVGDLSWIGIGACVRERISIGSEVMVGAGTVVVTHVSDKSTIIGVPGKVREVREG
jgi:sugar O-acyltransferase (sialic acid O-acetyltransferase NeuD family)